MTVQAKTDFKWAFVGDLQMPYHDKRAVALFMKVLKAWKPQAIDFVGDIDDQLEYSSFSDGTTDEFFNQLKENQKENEKALTAHEKALAKRSLELDDGLIGKLQPPQLESINPMPFVKANAQGASEFYGAVRAQHKNANLHASLGNHDVRIWKYIDKKAPDYIKEITPNNLWGLDDLGITWRMYDDAPLERFGGIHVHHGATTTTTGLAVKSDIETYNVSLVRGHDHRGGVVYKSYPMTGTTLVGMGTGHLCDPSAYGLRYTINHSWEKGFGIGWVIDNEVHLQFIRISRDYKCVVDGKVFEG